MPSESKNVFERISEEYYNLTASEKKTADYVLKKRSHTQHLSITELAQECDVAEATVSRFCRRLGYRGYSAFRLALANVAGAASGNVMQNPLSGEVLESDSFEDMCRKLCTADIAAITQTMELIKEDRIKAAADILQDASKVLCMGQGGSQLLADEAAHLFTTAGGKFFPVADGHMQIIAASTMDETDAILYFSYSGATTDMMDTLSLARDRGAKTIMITRFPNSPGAAMADVVLQCGADENPLQLGSVGARVAQMFLLDVLFSELCRRNMDECREARALIAEAMISKHLKNR